jgi:hypothetical protein
MVTIKCIKKRLEHRHRLKLAGVSRPEPSRGPPVILWVQTREGSEIWELLPEWVANLVVSDLHNDATAERAAVYRRIPKNAPLDVAAQWLRARMGQAISMPDVTSQILAA